VCKSGGDRALIVTKSKGLFYCFAARKGGDAIALAAKIRGCGQNEAAQAHRCPFRNCTSPQARYRYSSPGNGTSSTEPEGGI
jgi:hypothetical protein